MTMLYYVKVSYLVVVRNLHQASHPEAKLPKTPGPQSAQIPFPRQTRMGPFVPDFPIPTAQADHWAVFRTPTV